MSFCAKVESSVWRMYLCNPLQESGFCFEFLSMRYWARKQAPVQPHSSGEFEVC